MTTANDDTTSVPPLDSRGTPSQALERLYTALNHPMKAGPKWVTYERQTMDAALKLLRELTPIVELMEQRK